jgi:hypothetical protein
MIEELVAVDKINISNRTKVLSGDARKNAFARTRYGIEYSLVIVTNVDYVRTEARTHSLDPQQTPGFFPLPEGAAFDEPHCSAPVLGIARNVIIHRRIWRGKPVCRFLSRLIT